MPQRKKRPLTTGKGTKSTPIPTPGRSPRRVSSKPSEASKVRAAKKTTSSKYRSRRQAASKAEVTKGGQGVSGSARVTTGRGRSGPKLPKLPSKSRPAVTGTGRKPSAAMPKESAARKAARLANRAAKGYRGAGGSALSKVGGVLGKAATRLAVPLAMVNEVRTMAKRQKRYNEQKAAMKRRKKK